MASSKLKLVLLALTILILQGCASLPSTEVMQSEAATFQLPKLPAPGKALVYVVRPSAIGALVRFNIFVDSKADSAEVGYTRGGQYIYFGITPGSHKIYSNAENWAEMTINAKAGEVIYLQQEPAFGIIMARNNIFKVEDHQGKYYVKTLSLGELIKPEGLTSQGSTIPSPEPIQPISRNQDINPADKLEQLDSLKKRGLITQKDYDSKKAEILKNL